LAIRTLILDFYLDCLLRSLRVPSGRRALYFRSTRGVDAPPCGGEPGVFLAMLLRSTFQIGMCATAVVHALQPYTTQIMIVPVFRGRIVVLANKASDIIRSRVAGASRRMNCASISAGAFDEWLRRSGFEQNTALSDGELRELANPPNNLRRRANHGDCHAQRPECAASGEPCRWFATSVFHTTAHRRWPVRQ